MTGYTVLFTGSRSQDRAFIEAVFGDFPDDENLSHVARGFVDAFDPVRLEPNAESWLKVVEEDFRTPADFTWHALEVDMSDWSLGRTLFVIDPSSPLDLIDLWNIRQFRSKVLPVNVNWVPGITDFLKRFVEANYRPLPRNPHGMMSRTTVEFARSISEEHARSITEEVFADVTSDSWQLKFHYDGIWYDDHRDLSPRHQRSVVSAATASLELAVATDDANSVRFQSLCPDFADRVGGNSARWANVLHLRDYGNQHGLALVLPSHLQDPHCSQIRLGDPLICSRDGFVLPQRYKDHEEHLRLLAGRDAILNWLERRGIKAHSSDAGQVADQLLTSVRGFWGAHILAHRQTLELLNKMAKSVRKGSGNATEEYPDRTVAVEEWTGLVNRRANEELLPKTSLDVFVKAGALRLGLSVRCPNCEKQNWYGLSELNLKVNCARCLQDYDFPQGSLDFRRTPWRFRVAGAYSVPDFAGGGYATVLSLRAFSELLDEFNASITYCTNLDLTLKENPVEVDFAFWYRHGRSNLEPAFVVGEAKSFAQKAIQRGDVARLRRVAASLPGTFVVVSVLKDGLTDGERTRLAKLARWGRVPLADGRPRAPVIVLTGTELFAKRRISEAWKEHGERHRDFVSHPSTRLDNLWLLADLTQQLYLDLPSYSTWLGEYLDGRRRSKPEQP